MNSGSEGVRDSATPAPGAAGDFLFPTPELGRNLDLLHHLVENSSRIALLKGPDGVGKSLLLELFGQQQGPNWRTCRIDASPLLQPEQLVSTLADCFGMPAGGSRSGDRLLRLFDDLQQDGWLPVVMIDDAQLLPLDTLSNLLQLYEQRPDQPAPFRLILLASPAIDDQLQALRARGAGTRSLQELLLLPLEREQARRMLQQFAQLQGEAGRGFSDGQLERLYRESGGLPGVLLKLAAARLQRQQGAPVVAEERLELKLPSGISRMTLLGSGIVLLVVVSMLLFQERINALFEGERSETGLPLLLPARERVAPLQRELVPQQGGMDARGGRGALELPEAAVPPLESTARAPAAASPEPLPADAASIPVITVEKGILSPPPTAPVTAKSEQASGGEPARAADLEEVMEVAAVGGDSAPPARPAASPEPTVAAQAARPDTPPPPATELPPAVASPPEPTPSAATERRIAVRGESWLRSQRTTAYTLQLIGVREEQAARQFIRKNGLRGEVAYFRTLRDGRPWFSVVYGIYPDRAAALAARKRLPGGLSRSNPWPRSLGSIQQQMKNQPSLPE